MKHITLSFVSIILVALQFLPAHITTEITHSYGCGNTAACLREEARQLDKSLGWPSQSDEFAGACKVYILTAIKSNGPTMSVKMLDFLLYKSRRPFWNQRAELYAEVYFLAGGKLENIPAILRPYYEVKR